MKTLRLSFLTLFLVMYSTLAAETPTANQGANAMAEKINTESNGLLCLIKFTKTNGQKSIINGVENYTMDCSVETLAIEDCAMTGYIMGGWEGNFGALKASKNTDSLEAFFPFGAGFAGNKQLSKGSKMTFTTKLEFELTERGWRTEGRIPLDKPFVQDLMLPQLPEEQRKEDRLGAADKELMRLRQLNTTNKVVSQSDVELRQLMVGKWSTGRHDYDYKADGTWHMLPVGISTTKGIWRIENHQLIEGGSERAIIEANDMQIVLKNNQDTYPYRYQKIGKQAVSDSSAKRDITIVCPAGQTGGFSFALECTGYYNNNKLVDIQVAGQPSKENFDQTKRLLHMGVDIAASEGSEIFPIDDGTVKDVVSESTESNFNSLGYMVMLQHDYQSGTAYSLYLHMSTPPSVKIGQSVVTGKTVLGYVGHTGAAFGNHLHMEVRKFPYRFFPRWANIYGVAKSDDDFAMIQAEAANSWIDPGKFGEDQRSSQPTITTEIPMKFHGVWTPNTNGIHPPGEAPSQISAKQWLGHESRADVKQVRINNNNEIVVEFKVSAEGEEYTEKRCIEISSDGNILTVFSGDNTQSKDLFVLYRARQINSLRTENKSGKTQNLDSRNKKSKSGSLRERTKQFDDL